MSCEFSNARLPPRLDCFVGRRPRSSGRSRSAVGKVAGEHGEGAKTFESAVRAPSSTAGKLLNAMHLAPTGSRPMASLCCAAGVKEAIAGPRPWSYVLPWNCGVRFVPRRPDQRRGCPRVFREPPTLETGFTLTCSASKMELGRRGG